MPVTVVGVCGFLPVVCTDPLSEKNPVSAAVVGHFPDTPAVVPFPDSVSGFIIGILGDKTAGALLF